MTYLNLTKFFHAILITTLIFVFLTSAQLALSLTKATPTEAATVYYASSDVNIANPERGFFSQNGGFSPTVQELIDSRAERGVTLMKQTYQVREFINSPFSDSFIQFLKDDASIFRAAGAKIWLNFQYSNNDSQYPNDASAIVIKGHLEQLKPYMEENKDVIAGMASSWVGAWGEFGDSDNANLAAYNQINDNTRLIYEAIMENLPKERSYLARRQVIKKQFYGAAVLSSAEAFGQSDKARVGHQDDSFVGNELDGATYTQASGPIRDAEEAYLNQETKYVPSIGEVEYFDNGVTGQCTNAKRLLKVVRMSSLNENYNLDTLNLWKTQGCYDEIAKNLGYRLKLINSSLSPSATTNQLLPLKITLKNEGYAAPFNPRGLEVVLRDQSGLNYRLNSLNSISDPRLWSPDNGEFEINLNPSLSNVPAGQYSVFVNLPDPLASLSSNPAYSIQFANQGTWEQNTGYNKLNQNITITNSATQSSSTSVSSTTTVQSSIATVSSNTTVTAAPTISAKLFLSANFVDATDTMKTALRDANYLPKFQPYSVAPFNYNGSESVTNIPTTIVDWVLLELLNSNNTVVQQKAVLLNNDGKLVDPYTLSNNITLDRSITNGNYKTIIRHRNHIAIATDFNNAFVAGSNTSIDFTTNNNVKSSNQIQVGLNSFSQPIFGMYKGNITGDASIGAADRNAIRNAPVSVGYHLSDADLSGNVDAADRNLVRNAQVTVESI